MNSKNIKKTEYPFIKFKQLLVIVMISIKTHETVRNIQSKKI